MNQPDYLDVPKEFPPVWASAYGQDVKGYWLELSVYDQSLRFRWIPKGQFTMGSDAQEEGRDDDEDQHTVILSRGFWLAETTVTQVLWKAMTGKNPSRFQKGKTGLFPVENVSWDDSQDFIKKLNQHHPDLNIRLPWEAEWEYACRAGTETPFNFQGELTLDKVNYRGTWDDFENWGQGAKQATAQVKSYPGKAWGLYEMHGNVWEWCEDVWQENLGTEDVTDPWRLVGNRPEESEVGAGRVLRGGSWGDNGGSVRSAMRGRYRPDRRSINIGFRLSLRL